MSNESWDPTSPWEPERREGGATPVRREQDEPTASGDNVAPTAAPQQPTPYPSAPPVSAGPPAPPQGMPPMPPAPAPYAAAPGTPGAPYGNPGDPFLSGSPYAYRTVPTSNSNAIALVVVSAVSLLFCGSLPSIASLVLGILAMSNTTDQAKADKQVRIGWIILVVGLVLMILLFVLYFVLVATFGFMGASSSLGVTGASGLA